MNNQITEAYLKENHACEESYAWLRKQKNKDWRVLSQKLYEEKNYKWCLWMLCRKTSIARVYSLVVYSLIVVLEIGFLIELKNRASVAVTVVAFAMGVAIAFAMDDMDDMDDFVEVAVGLIAVAGLTVVAGAVGLTVVASIMGIAVTVVVFAMGVAFAFLMGAIRVPVAFAAVASNNIQKLICFLYLKKINRC